MTEFLLLDTVTLDIAAWPLHKNDSQDLSWLVFFERYGSMACTRMTRTNSVFFSSSLRRTHGSLLKDDAHKSSCWKFEREELSRGTQRCTGNASTRARQFKY